MSPASAVKWTLFRQKTLLQANVGVLGQKLDLMTALRQTLGPNEANQKFVEACPVVGASVGQHFRHSNDHMERVASVIEAQKQKHSTNDMNGMLELHYDIRMRGGDDENDMDAAEERIRNILKAFQDERDRVLTLSTKTDTEQTGDSNHPVLACFLLSGDSNDEFFLSSTMERELGFVAHHAIHHLAMVKIITMHTLRLLPPGGLPDGFGKAPSTIVYDKSTQ